jgi:Zn-dependent protease with chaperone function
MFKSLCSFFSVLFLSFSFVLSAAHPQGIMPPPRKDLMDRSQPGTQIKLQRAESILATLVPDPQSYQLVLSSRTSFGGEAHAPYSLSEKPSIVIYQGALAPSRSNEEIAFMMAHELGHLNLHHNEKMNEQMEKIFTGSPIGISGTTFSIFFQKLQEREADMFGFDLYTYAGYDLKFFPYTLNLIKINPNIHFGSSKMLAHEPSSLSMKDSHFSMKERFELLTKMSQQIS